MKITGNNIRSIFFQALLLAGIVSCFMYLFFNVQEHLAAQRIATGFDFLEQRAGFSISPHFIQFNQSSSYWDAFLVGIINTLIVSGISIVFATILGLLIGVMRLSKNWLLAKISWIYVEVIRNTPLLLQVFFWYYAVLQSLPLFVDSIQLSENVYVNNRGLFFPKLILDSNVYWYITSLIAGVAIVLCGYGLINSLKIKKHIDKYMKYILIVLIAYVIYAVTDAYAEQFIFINPYFGKFNLVSGWSVMPEFMAIVLALSLYTASYIAEIVRGGIVAVDHGQTEAAYALGVSASHTRKYVIIPQAMRSIIPTVTSQYLNLIKNSSLAAAIAFPELVSIFTGVVLNQTGQAIETVVMAMAVYLTISLIVSLIMNWYNNSYKLII